MVDSVFDTAAPQSVIDANQDARFAAHTHDGENTPKVAHADLDGRYSANQHRISNITDLEDELAARVGLPWKVDAEGNLYPEGGTEPGVGSAQYALAHVGVGEQALAGEVGLQGVITSEHNAAGGMRIWGASDFDIAAPPAHGNALLALTGSAIVIDGDLYFRLNEPITADHEALLGPSITGADGNYYSQLIMGPEKIYQHTETDENPADVDVLDNGPQEICAITLVNSYTPGVTTVQASCRIENTSGKTTDFTMYIRDSNGLLATFSHSMATGYQDITHSVALPTALAPGENVSFDIEGVGTHGQSQAWVRGSQYTSTLKIQQG